MLLKRDMKSANAIGNLLLNVIISAIHMHTFTYLCKFYIYVNFTHLCKSEHVNANTYPSIFTYVQISSWV